MGILSGSQSTEARQVSRPGAERLKDVVCIGGFVLALVYPLALNPFTPWLLATHPILLEALVGNAASLVTAGAFARVGRTALWLAVAAPVSAGDALDPFSWWVGKRFGRRLLGTGGLGKRYARAIGQAERILSRLGGWAVLFSYYLPIPNVVVYVLAAEAGMSLLVFIVLDLIGTALYILPFVLLGYALGQNAVSLAETITRNANVIAIAFLVVAIAYNIWRDRAHPLTRDS